MALIRLREPWLHERASKWVSSVVIRINHGLHHGLSHHWLLLLKVHGLVCHVAHHWILLLRGARLGLD